MVIAFSYIFHSFHLSCTFMMCIFINRISWNVALDGKPYFRTSTLLCQGSNPPQTTFLDFYDQTPSLHSLIWTSMIAFNHPRTTRCPRTEPSVQYILLCLSSLHTVCTFYGGKKNQFIYKNVLLNQILNFIHHKIQIRSHPFSISIF